MVVPPEVKDVGIACKRFLFTTEFSGFLILILFQNNIFLSIGIRLLIEAIVAAYFYLKCSDSSGNPLQGDDEQELSQLSISTQQRDNSQQEQQVPQKNFCQECKLIQAYRTKHCKKCKKCIPKYDHHCFWVGGCIGELNHRTFWLFLFFQCLLCFDGLFQFNQQLSFYSIYQEDLNDSKYQYQYFIILLFGVISFGFGIFTGALLLYHTMLILTGQTTWEHTKRDKITYLKFYPKFYHPYNYGLIQNIKLTFYHKNQQSHWIPPQKDQIQEQCNIFDNKYYSCC